MEWFLLIIIIFLFSGLLIWATTSSLKQSKKDWEFTHELMRRSDLVSTKEEIENLHDELVSFGKKTNNEFIHFELSRVDGYLRGRYKSLKTNDDGNN